MILCPPLLGLSDKEFLRAPVDYNHPGPFAAHSSHTCRSLCLWFSASPPFFFNSVHPLEIRSTGTFSEKWLTLCLGPLIPINSHNIALLSFWCSAGCLQVLINWHEVGLMLVSPIKLWGLRVQGPGLLRSQLSSQFQVQGSEHSRCWISVHWMNEWMDACLATHRPLTPHHMHTGF